MSRNYGGRRGGRGGGRYDDERDDRSRRAPGDGYDRQQGNRFGPLANQNQRDSSAASARSAAPPPDDPRKTARADLRDERPLWLLSCYSLDRKEPSDLLGDVSPEEARWHDMQQLCAGRTRQQLQSELNSAVALKMKEVNNMLQSIQRGNARPSVGGPSVAVPNPYISSIAGFRPSGFGPGAVTSTSGSSAGATPSPFGKPAATVFGRPSAPSAFGQPGLQRPASGGQAAAAETKTVFGVAVAPPSAGGANIFGKPAGPALFGQPAAPAATFGSQQQPTAAFGGSGEFNAAAAPPASAGGMIFGKPPPSGTVFGTTPAVAASPFTAAAPPHPFGMAPQGTGFGIGMPAAPPPPSFPFGVQQPQAQPGAQQAPLLFGARPAAAVSAFGNSGTASGQFGVQQSQPALGPAAATSVGIAQQAPGASEPDAWGLPRFERGCIPETPPPMSVC